MGVNERLLRPGPRFTDLMSIDTAFALVIVIALLGYLVAALIFPRHF